MCTINMTVGQLHYWGIDLHNDSRENLRKKQEAGEN